MEQINVFDGGWHQDSDPSLQQKNTYRDALNGNLINMGGNTYGYESVKGTVKSFTLPTHQTGASLFTPIGWYAVGDKLLIHSAYSASANGADGEIGVVTFDSLGIGTYSALYFHSNLFYSTRKRIEGYGLYENDAYQRSYWTDNLNQPRTLNIAAAILSTTIATGSLVVGEQYMVLTDSIGTVTHNATVYAPMHVNGNIFTAVNANYTTSGSVRVIKYLDINILNYTPEKSNGSIDFYSWKYGGNLKGGTKMYAYLLSTNDGYESDWSYTTNPISISHTNPSAGYTNNEGSTTTLTNTTKYIELQISDIPTVFDKIKVMVIEIDQDYEVVRNIEYFYFQEITGSTMIIPHYGGENLGAVLIDDLVITDAVITKVKTMCMIKQRQIIANLTEREELNWTSTATIAQELYTMPSDDSGFTPGNTLAPSQNLQPSSGVLSGSIRRGGHYKVNGVAGDKIEYNGIEYGPTEPAGDSFIGTGAISTYGPVTGTPTLMAVIRIQQYITDAGNPVYKYIEIKDDFFDFKGMASTQYLKTFWRKETYRVGVLFYDLFGNPYFVRWIDDVTIDGHNVYQLFEYGSLNGTFNLISLIINDLDITDIRTKISGVSIVIAKRDVQRMAQGLLYPIMNRLNGNGSGAANEYVPQSTTHPSNDFHGTIADYHCVGMGPDLDISTSIQTIQLQQGDELEPVSELAPLADTVGFRRYAKWTAGALDEEVVSKYYTHNDFTGNNVLVQTIIGLLDNATATFGGLYTIKNHDLATSAICPPASGGAAGSLQAKGAVGGQRIFFSIDSATITNTGTGISMNSSTNNKFLVNYKRPKGQLYGGTSDEAKANTIYYHTGNYLKIDSTVLANIYDAGTQKYILNGIQVFGGDTFVGIHERVHAMYSLEYDDTGVPGPAGDYTQGGSYSWGIAFPCESNINVALRYGRLWSHDGFHNNPNGVFFKLNVGGTDTYQPESMGYNDAYSSRNNKIPYAPLPIGFVNNSRYPYRARYSEIKTYGETIDNMRIFLTNNFREVDATYGEINNIRNGMDRLFYWQKNGIGYLPVAERETISNDVGAAIQLGVGGVMDRADIVDKFYGNQHQWSLFGSEGNWFWFDMIRRSFMRLSYSGQNIDISVIKGLNTFFSEAFNSNEGEPIAQIFDNDMPVNHVGISGFYDTKHKLAIMTFKFFTSESYMGPSDIRYDYSQAKDFTIAYSNILNVFIGKFSFVPGIMIDHNRNLLSPAASTVEEIFGENSYLVGHRVSKSGVNYVCIQDFTTSNPVAATEEPDYAGSVYWAKTSTIAEVHTHWRGDICKFYGIVMPFYLQPIVAPNLTDESSFDNAEVYGNSTALTDVYYENSRQTASDLNITAKNKNFRYIDNAWWFNFALSNKSRLVDHYLKIKLVVKNYTTNPRTSLNLKKTIVYLKTIYRNKK